MDARTLRARQIVANGRITRGPECYFVPSQQPGVGRYRVTIDGLFPSCTCPDFELTGKDCKHTLAVREWVEGGEKPSDEPAEPPAPVKWQTYKQDWPNYDRAQTREKGHFQHLLADLCASIPEPVPKGGIKGGRPAVPMADAAFAACFKVYSGFSARRFVTDVRDAADRGHMRKPIGYSAVAKAMESEALTPILRDLIQRSSAPLAEVETDFAVDSSGFCMARYHRWIDVKYGTPRAEHDWVKVHIVTGTRTNCVTAAEIHDKNTNDCNILPSLIDTTAERFTIGDVSADKAYAANPNFNAVNRHGGTLYAAFRKNTTGGVGGLFEKMWHLFCANREEYLRAYHRRSNVESTFSAIKRKFGEAVRCKTDTAAKNEVYAKMVCQNVCCLIAAAYELGLPVLPRDEDDEVRVIKFPGVG
jgi:transposase